MRIFIYYFYIVDYVNNKIKKKEKVNKINSYFYPNWVNNIVKFKIKKVLILFLYIFLNLKIIIKFSNLTELTLSSHSLKK